MTQKHKIILFVLILLTLGVGIFAIFQFRNAKKLEFLLEKTKVDKNALTMELKGLQTEYKLLQANNRELNTEIKTQQERIAQVLEELKNVKDNNVTEIKKYEKEIETLRSIMRSYIVQIDSLYTKNQKLTAEKKEAEAKYQQEHTTRKNLENVKDSLSGQVAKAEVVRVRSIQAIGLNEKGNSTDRARKTEKIQISFAILENEFAKTGWKDVFIRIANPSGNVLYQSATDLFSFEGKELAFSAKNKVDYQGKDTEMRLFWTRKQQTLPEGVYSVDVYFDGKNVGTTTFSLK